MRASEMTGPLLFVMSFGPGLTACTVADPGRIAPSISTGSPSGTTGGTAAVTGCHATPRPDDLPRQLLLSFPYTDTGAQADTWHGLLLDDGGLSDQGQTAALGRATGGRGVYSPDGRLSVIATDTGALSSMLDGEAATVGYTEGPYAATLAMDLSGEWLLATDVNWPNNGGGLYRVDIDCDTGQLTDSTLLLAAKGAAGIARQPGTTDRYALFAREVEGTQTGTDLHLLDLSTTPPTILSSIDAFGDEEAIVSDVAWDAEGQTLFAADYNEWSGLQTRVAVASADADQLTALGTVQVDDPIAIIPAPFADSSVFVVNGYGNAVVELQRTGDPTAPFVSAGVVASPSLPSAALAVTTGALQGQIFVVENQGLHVITAQQGGGAQDQGLALSWSGMGGIPGAIALQP